MMDVTVTYANGQKVSVEKFLFFQELESPSSLGDFKKAVRKYWGAIPVNYTEDAWSFQAHTYYGAFIAFYKAKEYEGWQYRPDKGWAAYLHQRYPNLEKMFDANF